MSRFKSLLFPFSVGIALTFLAVVLNQHPAKADTPETSVSAPERASEAPKPLPAIETPRTAVEVPVELPSIPEVPQVPEAPAPVLYIAPIDCPEEDFCRLDYTSDGQWVLHYGEMYAPERVFSVVLPVNCPVEDDCTAEYRGDVNRWVITENAPH